MSSRIHSAVVLPPPKLSLSDQLLASKITLPLDTCISYAIFKSSSLHPHESMESARTFILSQNSSAVLLDSLLTSLHIGSSSIFYVFLVTTHSQLAMATSRLNQLQLDGLAVFESSSFTPQDLYPCSPSCSTLREPCPVCLDATSTSTASLLPRKPLRAIYSNFIEAVRIRIIDDIVSISVSKSSNIANRQAKRLKGGFLLGTPSLKNEWSAIWERRVMARPLLFCQLQIHLVHQRGAPPYLMIHPLVISTSFLPLRSVLPLPAGTPIALLPHGTPAFFLTKYTGPTSALAKQFHQSLQGLGVSGWDFPLSRHTPSKSSSESPTFILAWISVENKQGEDKGIIIIYPVSLCLTFLPSSPFPYRSTSRQPLSYIPELPAPLQPSPQVPSALPTSAVTNTTTSVISSKSPISAPSQEPSLSSVICRPAIPSSPSFESLRAFRSLTLSRTKDIQLVAIEVGGYVDAVARERERERERLKREREREVSGTRTAGATPTSTSTVGPVSTAPDSPAPAVSFQAQPADAGQPQPQVQLQTQSSPVQVAANQTQTPTQSFYPSPPQTNPPIAPTQTAQTSPVTETNSVLPAVASIVESTTVPPSPSPTTVSSAPVETGPSASASASTTAYDSLNNNLDSTWSAQPQPYLDMGMDIDMEFGLDMGMGFSMGDSGDNGMDFEDAFTEDDFSFFDRPSANTPDHTRPGSTSTLPTGPKGRGGVVGGAGAGVDLGIGPAVTPPHFPHDLRLRGPIISSDSGSGPPLVPPVQQPPHSISNTISHLQASPFDFNALTPYLLPPSPGLVPTPSSHSVPPTPTVHLEPDVRSTTARIFDPIPFAAYHRTLDGKYALGKFAFPFSLPSPPDEEDQTKDTIPRKVWSPNSSSVDKDGVAVQEIEEAGIAANGWRSKYLAATDPRIGVVRKLIGVKRKLFVQGGRESVGDIHGTKKLMSPAWIREHEDWEKLSSPKADADSRIEADSESEDEDDHEESPIVSRPSTPTPTPAYLPLGPTLLSTHFEHSQLLPLCTPLRPPGAAVAPTNITVSAPAASVPTPVSPAAAIGAASDQSKSLEAAALTLATEVVENPPWADAWRASSMGARQPPEVWPADVRAISQLFEAVPGLESPLDIGTLFVSEAQGQASSSSKNTQKPVQLLDSPMISIGKGDAVIQILPTALWFWEKLGLGPRGGRKNGTAYILFEDDGEQRQQQVESWLATVSATYEGRHLGTLIPGSFGACPKNGLVPLRFDSSFRKSLTTLMGSLPASESSSIFFIVTPVHTMNFTSPVLRQVFSAVKKAANTHSGSLFQFVPEQLILNHMGNPSADSTDLEVLCASLYDRILLPIDRLTSRRLVEDEDEDEGCLRKYFQEPAFTLARPIHNKVSFLRAPRAPLDVMDRYTFVHIGYQVSPCGKWILAACVDQRGESHDLGVWLMQPPGEGIESEAEMSKEMFMVKKVWEFAVQFAKRANVEWRLVLSRLGAMGENEVEAWTKYLDATTSTRDELPMVHISLLSVEPDAPWTFLSRSTINVSPKPKFTSPKNQNNHPQVFTDISATFYAIHHRNHLPQTLPLTPADLGLSCSFIPEPFATTSSPDTQHSTYQFAYPCHLPPLPLSSTTLICLPAVPSPTSITMLHIHLHHVIPPLSAIPSPLTATNELSKLHTDITRNFHELAVLAGARWRLGVNPLLPFHLGAVEAMQIALEHDRQDGGESMV